MAQQIYERFQIVNPGVSGFGTLWGAVVGSTLFVKRVRFAWTSAAALNSSATVFWGTASSAAGAGFVEADAVLCNSTGASTSNGLLDVIYPSAVQVPSGLLAVCEYVFPGVSPTVLTVSLWGVLT